MDVVYLVGDGSPWHDNELKYSLRSLEKYTIGVDRVFIVGTKPYYLNDNVYHIPFEDDMSLNKERRIMEKLRFICGLPNISDQFLFVNDDHFFNKMVDIRFYPYFYNRNIVESYKDKERMSIYNESQKNTFLHLSRMGLRTMNFDIHYPIRYDKSLFIEAMNEFDWTVPFAYTVKSIYSNYHQIEGSKIDDCKINEGIRGNDFLKKIKNWEMFSIGDKVLNREVKAAFEKLYQERSKFED